MTVAADTFPGDLPDGVAFRPSKPTPRTGVKLSTFREYKARAKSTTDPIIEGLVRLGTLISFNARPGWGKTALMIEMSKILTHGELFLGRKTKQCMVIYFAVEDANDIANRLEAIDEPDVLLVESDVGLPLSKPAKAKEIICDAVRLARERFPALPVFVMIDTFRAGLGGQSVLEDKFTSPALNALREVAEGENVCIGISNHTNRENPKQTKGETLESVVSLELVLLQGEGGWYFLHVGKNRSGPPNRLIGRMNFTSIKVGGIEASVIDELIVEEGNGPASTKEKKGGRNQRLIIRIMQRLVADVQLTMPLGADSPLVRVIAETVLRDEYVAQKSGDDRDNKVRGFRAALESLLDNETIVRRENTHGDGILWFAKSDEQLRKAFEGADDGE